jgi:hypothetical protein
MWLCNTFFSFRNTLLLTLPLQFQIYFFYHYNYCTRYHKCIHIYNMLHSPLQQTIHSLTYFNYTHLCVIHFWVLTMLRAEDTETFTICATWRVVVVTEHVVSFNTCLVYWAKWWLTLILQTEPIRDHTIFNNHVSLPKSYSAKRDIRRIKMVKSGQ